MTDLLHWGPGFTSILERRAAQKRCQAYNFFCCDKCFIHSICTNPLKKHFPTLLLLRHNGKLPAANPLRHVSPSGAFAILYQLQQHTKCLMSNDMCHTRCTTSTMKPNSTDMPHLPLCWVNVMPHGSIDETHFVKKKFTIPS